MKTKRYSRILKTIPLILTVMLFCLSPNGKLIYANEQLPGVGAIGDSITDEYSQRAWYYGDSSAQNWVDLLSQLRGYDSSVPQLTLGDYQTDPDKWGAPRYAGYDNNFDLWGANTAILLSQGQHNMISQLVREGKIQYVAIFVGTNDFNPTSSYGMYESIYNQVFPLTGCDGKTYITVQDYADSIVNRYNIALDTVINAGGRPVMATIADFGAAPRTYNEPRYSDPEKRQHVTETIMVVNNSLKILAADKDLPIVDVFELINLFYVDTEPTYVGGVSIINDVSPGSDGNYGILPDGAHPGTVWQGLLANAFIEACNRTYGTNFTPLSDQEILAAAGVDYTIGEETFFDITPFVILPIPIKYSGGTGEPNDPYQIATVEDLLLLGESPDVYDKDFILVADIDLDPNLPGRKVFDKAVIAPDTDPNEWWNSFEGTPFNGIFDGNGHIISHLTITGDKPL